jgi:hypothetical protein
MKNCLAVALTGIAIEQILPASGGEAPSPGRSNLMPSKEMDQNSYDSGDLFNKIDWSGKTADWEIGLQLASKNESQWPIMTPLLTPRTPGSRRTAHTVAQLSAS